jgi:hypothetical protein
MNAPHGKLDAGGVQRLLARGHMLVDAVNQGAVQVKENAYLVFGHGRRAPVASRSSAEFVTQP